MTKLNKAEVEMHKTKSKITQLNQDMSRQNKLYAQKHTHILKFALDVHKIVQTKDDKAYVRGIQTLNQEYVNTSSEHQTQDDDNSSKKD